METPQRSSKSLWIITIVAALSSAVLGFMLSYQDEQTRFNEMASIAKSHLTYALQLKDDMALIDWSKGLEKIPSILTFRANSDSKPIAEGGNKQLCPITSTDGISFDFPYRWIVHSTLHKDATTSTDITMVFQDFRGPLFWSLCLFLICLGLGWTLIAFGASKNTIVATTATTISTIKPEPLVQPIISAVDNKSFILALDKDYVICQVTPLAAKALDRQVSDLVGSHFLDLLPDPIVMKAIEDSKEIKLLKPFPSHPHLSALLRPVASGTVLIFDAEPESERA